MVAVHAGDAITDGAATLLREAGGPIVDDPTAPQYAPVALRSGRQATQYAVLECFRLAAEGAFGSQPLLIRVDEWAAAVAGLEADSGCKLGERLCSWHRRCRATRDVWLTASRQGRGQWWADRAAAIARQCSTGRWGQPATTWLSFPALQSLRGAGDECPICFEDFADPLPRPQEPRARAPDTFHACGLHAACIGCDGRNHDRRCCLCRAQRHPWVQLP